jgi:hypothetical protein
MGPFYCIRETFGKHVCSLLIRFDVLQVETPIIDETLMQPSNGHTMRTTKMSHGWIPTRLHHPNHGLIVFMKGDNQGLPEKSFPQIERRQTNRPQG